MASAPDVVIGLFVIFKYLSVSLTSKAFAIDAAQSAFNLVLLKFNDSKLLLFLIISPMNLPASASKPL